MNRRASEPNASHFAADSGEVKQLRSQVDYLKRIIEDKEKLIGDLNSQQQTRHEEYQEKLKRFKEMQDQELGMSTKLREENTRLREEND